MIEFCKCGSIIVDGECSNMRCPDKNKELMSWIIDGVLVRFKEPVTYKEAVEKSKVTVARIKREANRKKDEDAWEVGEMRNKRVERIKHKR